MIFLLLKDEIGVFADTVNMNCKEETQGATSKGIRV